MPGTVLIGTQWGDEGKGKVIDVLAGEASWTVRFQGGANAGHTIRIGGERYALHLLPSGAVRPGVRCALGWGMVIDPEKLTAEIEEIEGRGVPVRDRLLVSGRATLLLPHHIARDGLEEAGRGGEGLGTTKRGIGPAYEDRASRGALLLGDLIEPDGEERFRRAHERANRRIAEAGGDPLPWEGVEALWKSWREKLGPLVGDVSAAVNDALDRGEEVLFEGAQGTHLDLYAGTFPFVTSSSTLAGNACAGSGVGPGRIERVFGVTKAYTTRVGTGPFPTEQVGPEGERLRERGAEWGTTTGRPRRCGWLDLPLLRASVRWNGVTGIALTKLDVLSGLERIPVCVAYELGGKTMNLPPASPAALGRVRPVYEEWPGWKEIPETVRDPSDLPEGVTDYVRRVARGTGAPVVLLSTGPERDRTLRVSIGP
ncbi:MAG: adenylosuccinate synthase [Candidatus Eisenbacteria bacterium]